MGIFEALVLGVVQGLTEFLPISSSGHLVFFQTLFGIKEPMMAFDVALHGGTLVAILVFFRNDIGDMLLDFDRTFKKRFPRTEHSASSRPIPHGLWIRILVTLVPTGIIAFFFKDRVEEAFSNLNFVAGAWLVMGFFLFLTKGFVMGRRDLSVLRYGDAFWIGVSQGIAIMPGISRSGSTILMGMLLGLRQETAAKFSFLIAIPVVGGALLLKMGEMAEFLRTYPLAMLAGVVSSAVTGYYVITFLMYVIRKGRFFMFGYYCIILGLLSFAFTYFS